MARFSDIAAPADLGRFIDAEERDAMIEDQTPLLILGVRDDPHNRFAGKPAPRYLFDLAVVATGEKVTLGLRQNAGRDHMVGAVRDAIEAGETIEPVCLVVRESKEGNEYTTFDDAPAAALTSALAERETADAEATAADEVPAAKLTRSRKAKVPTLD